VKIKDVIWTGKMKKVLADNSQVLFLGGATGCSKSLVAGHVVMDWLLNLPKERTQFYIIFKDRGTGVRNFLHNKASFYNMYPHLRADYSPSREGGLQFKFYGLHGEKIVYILGADDRTSWSKILGSNPDGMWLEELSELHIQLVRECFGRAISRRCRLIATTNGGLPSQEFYTEFLNHAIVQDPDNTPAAELAEMVQDKPYMHYYHFNLADDSPHLGEEDKAKLRELYPIGSFYHNSKVLGCRGFVEGAAYAPLMDKAIHLRDFEDLNQSHLKEIVLSVDIGSSTEIENKKRSATVATLVGFSKGYQRAVVLEHYIVPSTSHDEIIKQLENRIESWWVRHMTKFTKIVIDSAETILINTWKNKTRFKTLEIKGAVKYVKDQITLVSRCQLKQQLLTQERLLWTDRAFASFTAHTHILLDEDGAELDLNVQDNDTADSLTYALTENWNYLTKQERRRR